MRPAVFLDRDGTLIEEVGYLNHVSRFRMFPFVPEAIRRFNKVGLPVIVISNQSGVGRGYFPESFVKIIHNLMSEQLGAKDAHIDGFYYCPHVSADGCDCRKPKPGMLDRAARERSLDLARSFVVGDRHVDMELAHRVGARGVFVRTGYGEGELAWHGANWPRQPEYVANDLTEATDWILRLSK
jgi:D-glycero-D-manno-heptose 1,7-bisphosphate phosphatase